METAISKLQVTIVDHLVGPYSDQNLKSVEDHWITQMGSYFSGENSKNELLTQHRRNWGNAL